MTGRSSTTLADIPISFDVPGGVTHAPMVDVTIDGVATRLILDTGSTDHVLTVHLARAVGLALEPGQPGTDHAGASVPSWTVGDLAIDIGGTRFDLHDVVAIDGPSVFGEWGIGGFLSPQHLHPEAVTVLDLRADRLAIVDGAPGSIPVRLAERHRDLSVLTLARDLEAATPVVSAAIEPFDRVPTMLNTGGRGTEFAAWAVPGLIGGDEHEPGHGVGGSVVAGTSVVGRTLDVGGVRCPVPRLLIREEIDGLGGLIGMDVLRGTALAVAADRRRPVHWLVSSRDM
jgi:Aspartyl protease